MVDLFKNIFIVASVNVFIDIVDDKCFNILQWTLAWAL